MGRIMVLKHSGHCHQCKAPLAKGDTANYVRPRVVYGLTCHNTDEGHIKAYVEGMMRGFKENELDQTPAYLY